MEYPLKSYIEDGRVYSDDDVELGDINKNINYEKKKELESQLVVSNFYVSNFFLFDFFLGWIIFFTDLFGTLGFDNWIVSLVYFVL